ncbi:LysR family transcriptional regulator [Paracoccus sp. pheM1]|uniref:LysR family transcriptional regulator n=1 Tax=Paracoccus sp. pheM1 TaxID=2831675 RepID=UPI001BDB7838|nr:LysR family transcriptional regulator [Paracoccus sp. pheM1]MBT0780438.1 LysR family transcriptional regulator [Paracoccus sp. pheM1]WGR60475.1 LysR family transcriptional regulator [Paracoccus ferrooxidans]
MRYDLNDLETFLTVMELGTVTAAAARLNLSKSVVSKRITDLEATLGAALFRRNAGRITPTEAALRLAERLRPALAELVAAAESTAWDMDGLAPLRGSLSVAAPMSFGVLHLGPIIARFAAQNPELEISVDYDDRSRDLAREGFDIGIRIGKMRDKALMQRKLCEDASVACASPAYLDRKGRPQTLADLREHEVIGYSHLPNSQLWQFQDRDRFVSPLVQGRLSMNNGEAIRDMAVEGLGLAILPGFIVAPALADGRLERVLPGFGTRPLPIVAVWPPVLPMPAKLRRFIDHVAAELRQPSWQAGWGGGRSGPISQEPAIPKVVP